MASGVVTRSPAVNVDSHAEPVELRADLRAAAVHHDRAQPGVAQEHHVLGEGLPERLVGHRVAAVLDHDGLAVEPVQPGQRLDQRGRLGRGVGSIRLSVSVMSSTPSSRGRRPRSGRWSRWWRSAGPADRSTVIVTSSAVRSTLAALVAGGAVAADPDAVDRDVQPVRLELGVGGADRG